MRNLPSSFIRRDSADVQPDLCAGGHLDGFGLPGPKPLLKKVETIADAVRTDRAVADKPVMRDYVEIRHEAGSWTRARRAVVRVEATRLGLRFTNLGRGSPEWIYDSQNSSPWAGREPDQAAQGPTAVRPHLVPLGARQPGPPRPAHGRRLADAGGEGRRSQGPRPCRGRGRDGAPAAAQDRRQGGGNASPRAPRLCRGLFRGQSHRWSRVGLARRRIRSTGPSPSKRNSSVSPAPHPHHQNQQPALSTDHTLAPSTLDAADRRANQHPDRLWAARQPIRLLSSPN